MLRKLMIICISLAGLTLALGSNAWADPGKNESGHGYGKDYHRSYKVPPGHHYGWDKDRGNPHKDRYDHHREYRHRDRYSRWDRDRRGRDHRWDRDRHHDGHINAAFSIIDDAFGMAVAVGGRR